MTSDSAGSAATPAPSLAARAWTPRRFSILVEAGLWLWMAANIVDGVLRPLLGSPGLGLLYGTYWGRRPSVDATLTEDALARVPESAVLPGPLVGGPFPPGEYVETYGLDGFTVVVQDTMSARQWTGLVGGEILAAVVSAVVLSLFILMVRDLRRGDLFRPLNLTRLYRAAVVLAVGGMASVLLHVWGRHGVLLADRLDGVAVLDWTVSLNPLLLGVALLVVAEALRQGIRLRADTEGLV
jgi:hypothetical protein